MSSGVINCLLLPASLSLHLRLHQSSESSPKAPDLTGLLPEGSTPPGADDSPGAAADPEGICCTRTPGRAPKEEQWSQGSTPPRKETHLQGRYGAPCSQCCCWLPGGLHQRPGSCLEMPKSGLWPWQQISCKRQESRSSHCPHLPALHGRECKQEQPEEQGA